MDSKYTIYTSVWTQGSCCKNSGLQFVVCYENNEQTLAGPMPQDIQCEPVCKCRTQSTYQGCSCKAVEKLTASSVDVVQTRWLRRLLTSTNSDFVTKSSRFWFPATVLDMTQNSNKNRWGLVSLLWGSYSRRSPRDGSPSRSSFVGSDCTCAFTLEQKVH